MPPDVKQAEQVSPDVQEVIRTLGTAIRAVKIYPPNNPIYAQSVRKAFDALEKFLRTEPEFPLGIQKTFFLFAQTPVARETEMNRPIAQDLFTKGIREIRFLAGISEEELLELLRGLALSSEEMAMRSGIVSILWEKGATHVKVTEAALDEVIVAHTEEVVIQRTLTPTDPITLPAEDATKEFVFSNRTLVLGDIVSDPKRLASTMLELAKETVGESQTVEDRLHELYKEAGRLIAAAHPEQSDSLFQGLAQSVLEMEPRYRDHLVNAKLYAELDAESAQEFRQDVQEAVPHHLHEIMTGRFNKEWTVQQIATLLRKSSERQPSAVSTVRPADVVTEPIPKDLAKMAQDLSTYTAEEMETLRIMGESGMEADVIEAAVRTLLFLLPLVKDPHRNASADKDAALFAGIVQQLEGMTDYLVNLKDFGLAMIIIRAFRHFPAPPEYQQRLRDAFKKVTSREFIMAILSNIKSEPKSSAIHKEAFACIKLLAHEATPYLLETLAGEQDRATRFFLMEIIKELGKGQLAVIAQGLTDTRWFVVRNIVHILAESRSEQAVPFLEKVQDHKNENVRQEVMKGLVAIGGRRAASLVARYLKDHDPNIQLMAVRSLATTRGAGPDEAQGVMDFLERRHISKDQEENAVIIDAINTLGKIGKQDAMGFLERYNKIRWWKARRPQEEVRAAARATIEEMRGRLGRDGRTG